MRIFYLTTALFLIRFCLPAQDLNVKIIPPSPNAASLGKYAEYPVSLNNGLVNISIPLFEAKSGKLKLPINISYHGAGVKAYDMASSVGLGWTLNAGGAITRVVNSLPDEYGAGFLNNPLVDPNSPGEHFFCFLAAITKPVPMDAQADMFMYNLNGSSGKFLFKNPRPGSPLETITIPYSPIQIKVNNSLSVFTIIDLDGTKYSFAQKEVTQITTSEGSTGSATTAWYVTSIVSPDHGDSITFSYTVPSVLVTLQSSTSLSVKEDPEHSLINNVSHNYSSSNNIHSTPVLSEINFKNGKVSFAYDDRVDIPNGKRLISVSLSQKNNGAFTVIKKFNLGQTYFSVSGSTQTSQIDYLRPDRVGSDEMNKRLRLDNIYEQGFLNGTSVSEPPYTFEYETAVDGSFPVYGSTAQDFMGYYNGAKTNKNLLFYDYGVDYLHGPLISKQFGANRNVNPAYIKAGSLKKITYPTGGYSVYETEPNQVTTTVPVTVPNVVFSPVYQLTTRHLSQTDITFTVTLPSGADAGTLSAIFKCDLVIVSGEPPISTTVTVFDVTDNVSATFVAETGPPVPASVGIPSASAGLSISKVLNVVPNHTYTLSYGTSVPVTGNVLFTSVQWSVNAGTTTSTQTNTEFIGGLRIKSITNYDGTGKFTKKKYVYTGAYHNSNLYNGNPASMAELFKNRSFSFEKQQTDQATVITPYWHSNYGENVTFQLGSAASMVSSYGEVEEHSVDDQDHSLGKTVTSYRTAIDFIPSMIPHFRTDWEWKRGQVQSQKIYKSDNSGNFILINQQDNTYHDILRDSVVSFYAILQQDYINSAQWIDVTMECQYVEVRDLFQWLPQVQYSYRTEVSSSIMTEYDEDGLNPHRTQTLNYYDNPVHQLLTRKTDDKSDGRLVSANMKYPLDYPVTKYSLDSCYTKINSTIDSLSLVRQANETYSYGRYSDFVTGHHVFNSPPMTGSDETTAEDFFNTYMGHTTAYQSQVAIALTAFNNCKSRYNGHVAAQINSATGINKALLIMQRDNELNSVIETSNGIIENGVESITAGGRNGVKAVSVAGPVLYDTIWTFNSATEIVKSTFDVRHQTYYRNAGRFISYDGSSNLTEKAKDKDVSTSYIWDYNKEYPIAEATNASTGDIAYTSFESDGSGGWGISGSPRSAAYSHTGLQSYDLTNGQVSKTSLNAAQTYLISFWAKTTGAISINNTTLAPSAVPAVSGWQFYQSKFTGTGTVSVSGTGLIDEIRLCPAVSLMTTYTYSPLVGVTCSTDASNQTTYFEYDALSRLVIVRDQNLNIVKRYTYHYKLDN